MSKEFFGRVYHSWTQPYPTYQWPKMVRKFNKPGITKQEMKTIQEMARWDWIDKQVNAMSSFPAAERMIRNLKE